MGAVHATPTSQSSSAESALGVCLRYDIRSRRVIDPVPAPALGLGVARAWSQVTLQVPCAADLSRDNPDAAALTDLVALVVSRLGLVIPERPGVPAAALPPVVTRRSCIAEPTYIQAPRVAPGRAD